MKTYGEALGHAMQIQEQSEADAYFEVLVTDVMKARAEQGKTTLGERGEAEALVRNNLGYWAGYYDNETRARVEKLFRCAHPVFGAKQRHTKATPPVDATHERQRECSCGWWLPRDLETHLALRTGAKVDAGDVTVMKFTVDCPKCGRRWSMGAPDSHTDKVILPQCPTCSGPTRLVDGLLLCDHCKRAVGGIDLPTRG